jgi:gliding motility-associated-like protein
MIPHLNQETFDFTDTDVDVNTHQYFYKLYLLDDCNNIIDSSRALSTVLLKGQVNKEKFYQQLFWKKYYDELNTEKIYQLYRFSESETAKNIYSNTNMYYLDDLKKQDFQSFVGEFCYYIVVDVENYEGDEPIRSNTVCLSQKPSVVFPNAFAPNSYIEQNTIFKPSFTFISSKNYYFAIYDRWGNRIFETTDYSKGWTGKKEEQTYNNGVYIYYLEYSSSNGTGYTKTGTFNLID